ncbi:hypothetical protein SPRG_07521 [Saprolegnia parasitica CBS 223.65]|uniref:Nucleotide exchange factor Fes1 domain-containing protein n=1 Tax=Saprolegnia parasitica (strain CBS 223.65) TaxID=695850 RepID=A0A067CKG1_SAPPC|nr:hypothetical protein SPRG_07521 [Saprolegnia parasitica CBS 223.65]KDO27272.1 hypothetical protein SPRG_07521 [Saprolegnia parasitica CBS 223.65]|eukprot:XP_012202048.1 hypothetical protein SPRG_07521 [Saprolegnia parasitica CBS 223.65]
MRVLQIMAMAVVAAAATAHQVAIVPSTESSMAPTQTCELTVDGVCAPAPPLFEPTREWQEILPNQAIPGGLHVRINLATGKKEAKLLTDDDDIDATPANVPTPEVATSELTVVASELVGQVTPSDVVASPETKEEHRISDSLYNVLAGLPEPPVLDGINIHDAHAHLSKEAFAAYVEKLWKARQAELKEASEAIRNEAKYMQTLIDALLAPTTPTDDVLDALTKLEWEVQDLDKARDFNTLGGLVVTVQFLNATDLAVRAQAMWVVGSAIKHFEEAQNWALQAGAVPHLLQSLAMPISDKAVVAMQRKALYALSALLQSNAKCQAVLLAQDGVRILNALAANANAPLQLRLKAVLVLHHLLAEHAADPSRAADVHAAVHATDAYCAATAALLTDPTLTPKLGLQVMEALAQALMSPPSKCTAALTTPAVAAHVKALDTAWRTDPSLDADLQEDATNVAITLLDYLQALAGL